MSLLMRQRVDIIYVSGVRTNMYELSHGIYCKDAACTAGNADDSNIKAVMDVTRPDWRITYIPQAVRDEAVINC